ncbi:MAG TPA: PAS domain S-box protein [Verrucomicrobiae bacterium]|nr:PAS domain S-box protein [Verrucomicrobiae bacterium]
MPSTEQAERVLIIAPVGQDAATMAALLRERGWFAEILDEWSEASGHVISNAGALVLTEEALELPGRANLLEALRKQPAWSELPLVILTQGGESRVQKLLDSVATAAGSVTLLERPLRANTLVRSMEVALRSRRRQYQVRDLLEQQRRDQERLRQSEDRYRAFIANSSEGIWRMEFDPPGDISLPVEQQVDWAYQHGRLVECNDAMARMYGLNRAEELVGKRLDFMLPDSPQAREYVASIIRAGYRAIDTESAERDVAGNTVYFSNSMTGLVEKGRLLRMWGTQRNITERKRAEEALRESEARYRALFDSIDEGFSVVEVLFDAAGRPVDYRFLEVNAAFERHTGLAAAPGKTIRELLPTHDQQWFDIYGRVALTGEPVRFQDHLEALHRWFDAFAFRVGSPEYCRVAVIFNDITERKRADEARARLAAIVEFSEDAIISKDSRGIVTTWNHGAERLFGYTAEEAIGKPIGLIIPPDRQGEEAVILDRVRHRRPVEHYETVRRHKNGALLNISLTVSPIVDASGKVVGASKIARDITERKRTDDSLKRRAAELLALYQLTDQLNRAASLTDVYRAALDAIISAIRCDRASVLFFDEKGVMRFAAWRGLSQSYREAVEGHAPWTIETKDPQPVWIADIETGDVSDSLKEIVRREGIRALAFVPIVVNGKLIGKFMAYHNLPHALSREELNLALTIARQLGFAVERKRADERLAESERRAWQRFTELEAIYESTPLGMSTLDTQLRFRRVNERMARIDGVAMAEHIGKTVREVIPSLADQAEHALHQVLATGRPARFEFHGETRARPGVERIWDERWYPLRDKGGEIAGVGIVAEEITERKRWEAALRESEDRFRTLVEQVKDYAIFRIDNQGRPTSWNEGVERVFGFTEKEFLGQEITSIIFTPEDVAADVPLKELQEAAETGTASNDRWMRRKDGTRFYAAGATTGLRNEAGELIGFTKVVRDETAAKLTEEALADARARLQEHATNLERIVAERTHDLRTTNEQLEAFVYSIAHDLRAPLRSMSGFSQLLMDGYAAQLDETAQDLLRRIQSSSEFMDKLLMDLLAYGRTARSEMELLPVDVHKAWEAALFQCHAQINDTRAQVEAVEPLPTVRAHEATLGQCLANLLSNALKFVASGVTPRVRFWAEDRGELARLWIEDNGIGIAPDQRERAFRVFERLHGARYVGTGIGLSIVRKGIERMGGLVGLESMPGKGSRFWIELPKVG